MLTKEELEKLPPFNPLKIMRQLAMIGAIGGVLGGLLSTGLFLFLRAVGLNPWLSPAKTIVLDGGVVLILVVFLLLFIRMGRQPQILKLWEGLISGMVGVVTCASVAGLSMFVVAGSLASDDLKEYKTEMGKQFEEVKTGMVARKDSLVVAESPEWYEQRVKTLDQQLELLQATKAESMMWDEFGKKCFFGFFIVPLASLVLRKR